MKRLALVFGLGLALGSCDRVPADKAGSISMYNYSIKEVTFNGHLYNAFVIDRGGSLSHSPNCKCMKKD